MRDPRTFWLIVTNILLGLAVLSVIVGVVTGTLWEFVARLRKRHALWAEMDEEMRRMFHDSAPGGRSRH